jgi:hypothetical protein
MAVGIFAGALAQYALLCGSCHGAKVEIWDQDMPGWTTTLWWGDPMYQGPIVPPNGRGVNQGSSVAVDPNGIVYAAYCQGGHVYFSKYDGRDVRTWDSVNLMWQTELPAFSPVDCGVDAALRPLIRINSNGVAYIAYEKELGGVYLHRYNGVDLRIWDNDALCWTLNRRNGDRIDAGLGIPTLRDMEIDSRGYVYLLYTQHGWRQENSAYLSRYNGKDVRIWDRDTSSWTTAFWKGDPIDKREGSVGEADMAFDLKSNSYIGYIAYTQDDQLYLNRYDGKEMRIWDSDGSSWTADLQAGDPVDTGAAPAMCPQIAVSPNIADPISIVYLTHREEDQEQGWLHLYLNRYDGRDVRIWDQDAAAWTTAFWKGDRIDKMEGYVQSSSMAIDRSGVVYLTFAEEDMRDPDRNVDTCRIYLERCNGRDVRMWNMDTDSWTNNLETGTPIDMGADGIVVYSWDPCIAIDSNGFVYVSYEANPDPELANSQYHVYLSRYNRIDVTTWDKNTSSWLRALEKGDCIDWGGNASVVGAQIAMGPRGIVYCLHSLWWGPNLMPYLSRYNPN